MKTTDLADASRPFVNETGIEAYPYFLRGAGFLATFEDVGLLITAKHAMKNLDPAQILVFPQGSRTAIPFLSVVQPTDDESFADLAFFPFWPRAISPDAPEWDKKAVPLSQVIVARGRAAFKHGTRLRIAGCPAERRGIPPDTTTIAATIVGIELRYDARDPDREWIHRAIIVDQAGLSSLAGISGSPVYWLEPPDFGLSGVVIEASNGICHFIDSAVVFSAARKIRDQLPATAP